MATVYCMSNSLKEILVKTNPDDNDILNDMPVCPKGDIIRLSKEEKEQGVISKAVQSIATPVGEFVAPITKPVGRFVAPVLKPVAEATGAVINPMVEPTKNLAKKVGVGVIVSLVVIAIVKYIGKYSKNQ